MLEYYIDTTLIMYAFYLGFFLEKKWNKTIWFVFLLAPLFWPLVVGWVLIESIFKRVKK